MRSRLHSQLLMCSVAVMCLCPIGAHVDRRSGYRLPSAQDFLVLAPHTVRPMQTYEIHTTLFRLHYTDITVRAVLSRDGEEYATAREIFNAKGTKRMQLMVPEQTQNGTHRLVVEGLVSSARGDPVFRNETQLVFQPKYISLFIQTDRPVYHSPGTVRFRVIGVTPDLKPVPGQAMIIYVQDAAGNTVRRWLNQELNLGLYSNSFAISYPVNEGTWKILVKTHGHRYEQDFNVRYYWRGRWEVNITTPLYIKDTEWGVSASLNGEHFSSKMAVGNATIEVRLRKADGQYMDGIITKKLNYVDRIVPVEFRMSEMKAMWGPMAGTTLFFKAYMYEWHLTETKSSHSATRVFPDTVLLRALGPQYRTFKPGIPFTLHYAVTGGDGAPYERFHDRMVQVEVSHEGKGLPVKRVEKTLVIPSTSIVRYDVTPREEDTKIHVTALHTPSGAAVEVYLYRYFSINNRYLSISTSTEEPMTDSYMTFTVRTNFFVEDIHYMITAGGNILLGKVFNMYAQQKTFSLALSRQMAPRASILVYCVTDGEILTDSLNFFVKDSNLFNASIRVNYGKDFTQDTIEVVGRGDPGGYFAVSAADYEFYRRGADTFLTETKIVRELMTYGEPYEGPYKHTWYYGDDRWQGDVFFTAPTGGIDTSTTFDISGLVALSDLNMTLKQEFTACNRSQGVGICLTGQCYDLRDTCDGLAQCSDGYDEAACPLKDWEVVKPRAPDIDDLHVTSTYYANTDWFWKSSYVKPTGQTEMKLSVPETINPYVFSAFVLHPVHGLSLVDKVAMHDTTRRFYMTAEAPGESRRGEQIGIRLGLYNNWDQDLEVIVTLHGGEDYRFINIEDQGYVSSYSPRLTAGDVQLMVEMPSRMQKYIHMPVVPIMETGKITVRLSAFSHIDRDTEAVSISVLFDGAVNYDFIPFLIDLNNKGSLLAPYFDIPIPQQFIVPGERDMLYIPGSNKAVISAWGDVVSPGFFAPHLDTENTQSARLPHDSAEGYMFDYAINLQTLRYLKSTRALTDQRSQSARKYMKSILMRQYSYMQKDGAFKMFRRADKPCVWLTSFVLKTLHETLDTQWADDIFIPVEIVNKIALWLASVQQEDGSFHETATHYYDRNFLPNTTDRAGVVHEWHIPVTAHVIITLATSQRLTGTAKVEAMEATDSGADYLASKLGSITDPFQMAITAYALQMAKHRDRDNAFQTLRTMNTTEDRVYWAGEKVAPNPFHIKDTKYYMEPLGDATNLQNAVMATSYALMLHIQYHRLEDAEPIMKWLVEQRIATMSWSSTLDTLLALQALTTFALEESNRHFFHIQVRLEATSDPSWKRVINITHQNFQELQQFELPNAWGQVKALFEGTGYGFASVYSEYHVEKQRLMVNPHFETFGFEMREVQYSGRNASVIYLTPCLRWQGPSINSTLGMTVMTVTVPTGYFIGRAGEMMMHNAGIRGLKRAKFRNHDFHLFFDHITEDWTCAPMRIDRRFPVANMSIAHRVTIREYSETGVQLNTLYETYTLFHLHICQVCGSFQCPYCPYYNSAPTAAATPYSWPLLLLVLSLRSMASRD